LFITTQCLLLFLFYCCRTDSGVFEQGGIVVSKAGCIIKSATAQPDTGSSQSATSKQE
jgi:hypothetical protein